MLIVAIAWIYVVGMVALAEALAPQGTVLGAIVTFFGYGVLPLSVVLYLMGTPARKAALRRAEARALPPAPQSSGEGAVDPHRGGHAPGGRVAAGTAEREEP